jgi:hypothetical protein
LEVFRLQFKNIATSYFLGLHKKFNIVSDDKGIQYFSNDLIFDTLFDYVTKNLSFLKDPALEIDSCIIEALEESKRPMKSDNELFVHRSAIKLIALMHDLIRDHRSGELESSKRIKTVKENI